ncbi:MAG: elongation factor EF-2 [Candidatus Heimdallarchaeota archaeon]|nr:elongation factor EF-2 [Candidatus Heimdallarchaeota archaeon]
MVRIKNPDEIRQMIREHPMHLRRVFSICAHIDHGKTTTSDYLLRRAGLMSDQDAGEKLMTDSDEEEQERGITIFTSVVLLSYEHKGKTYLFEINDTPGHISFTGEVSRALRGSDGSIILVDALEGVMTQTETNIRLSIGEEMTKPVLYINKVDRLISELKLSPDKVFEKIDTIISQVNNYIEKVAPEEFADKWKVSFKDNSVAIGSAKDGWAFTYDVLLESGHKDPSIVFQKYAEDDKQWLRENLHLEEALLRMVIEHLPDPATAQKYKIPKIWNGDLDSEQGKALLNCDRDGPLLGMITKVFIDPRSKRPTLIGRIFSGTIRSGDTLELINQKQKVAVKRLGVMEITDILDCDEIPAGNLFAVFGFICPSGESFRLPGSDAPGFEDISYAAEPVVSRAIEPKDPQDIAKLGDVVSKWIMADPTANFRHDKESNKYILSGIDPLQIEILTKRINEQVDIRVFEPIIVYRERISHRGDEVYTKSPNGHNRLRLYIEPLDDKAMDLIKRNVIFQMQDEKERAGILRDQAGWDSKFARKIWDIYGPNIFVNDTSGVQRLDRIEAYVIQIFREFVDAATVAREPTLGLKVVLTDATVHTDPAHTGFSEVLGMTISALHVSFLTADPHLHEPILQIDIKTPKEYMGSVMALINQHRGRIDDTVDEEEQIRIRGTLPTVETLGDFADNLRSATSGRAFWGYEFRGFEQVPKSLEEEVIQEIRKRKDLPPEIPTPANWDRYIYRRR